MKREPRAIGTINFFNKLQQICSKSKGDCKNCKLGCHQDISDVNCPRLIPPRHMSIEKINRMIIEVENNG